MSISILVSSDRASSVRSLSEAGRRGGSRTGFVTLVPRSNRPQVLSGRDKDSISFSKFSSMETRPGRSLSDRRSKRARGLPVLPPFFT